MKEYTIAVHGDTGHTHEFTGTLNYLIDQVFGYTLECNGMYRDFKRPKTGAMLVKRLNEGRSYWSMRSSYELVK